MVITQWIAYGIQLIQKWPIEKRRRDALASQVKRNEMERDRERAEAEKRVVGKRVELDFEREKHALALEQADFTRREESVQQKEANVRREEEALQAKQAGFTQREETVQQKEDKVRQEEEALQAKQADLETRTESMREEAMELESKEASAEETRIEFDSQKEALEAQEASLQATAAGQKKKEAELKAEVANLDETEADLLSRINEFEQKAAIQAKLAPTDEEKRSVARPGDDGRLRKHDASVEAPLQASSPPQTLAPSPLLAPVLDSHGRIKEVGNIAITLAPNLRSKFAATTAETITKLERVRDNRDAFEKVLTNDLKLTLNETWKFQDMSTVEILGVILTIGKWSGNADTVPPTGESQSVGQTKPSKGLEATKKANSKTKRSMRR